MASWGPSAFLFPISYDIFPHHLLSLSLSLSTLHLPSHRSLPSFSKDLLSSSSTSSSPFHDVDTRSPPRLAGLLRSPEELRQMSCNGMAPSFFPPSFLLQMQTPHEEERHPSASLSSLLPTTPCSNPQDFQGAAPLLGKRSMSSFSGIDAGEEMNGEGDLSDDCSQQGEKKRRLNSEQVKTLEKNFEMGNKLEPERKMQLARALGLQPRQVAIWFQNRRARWKTKQLEKDYDVLKRQFEAIKAENDALQAQNKKLQAEVMALKCREGSEPINLNKETEGSCSNRSDNSSDINLDISRTPATDSPMDAQQGSRTFFQPIRPAGMAQLLQNPPSRPELQCPKMEQGVQDESFCSMLCGLDDQPGFWAWPEQHNFH